MEHEGKMSDRRGSVLAEAADVINGERQDVYGNPEDSFRLIADYWNVYLKLTSSDIDLRPDDVAMMMVLFKVAREDLQHKRDNIRDAAGYLGIYADMQANEDHGWCGDDPRIECECKKVEKARDEILNRK